MKTRAQTEMKTSNGHSWADPFDTVFDSMGAASGATGIPLQILKEMKRSGCDAFKGSRVHLGKLREALTAAKKEPEPGTADVLLMIVEQVARIVSEKLLVYRDAKFRAESRKLTQAIHTGFGAALCIVEPDSVDQFLKQSAALMENIFKSTRKECREAINREKDRSEES